MIEETLRAIRADIKQAAQQCARSSEDIKLMLVTKTVPSARIAQALAAGEQLIGENKVQELRAKYDDLVAYPHQTHMIGHLQSNKVKDIVGYVDCLQSLDRVKLAHKLQQRLEFCDTSMDVLVQVNTSNEASKFGVSPQDTLALIREIRACDRIKIKGLMTIGANSKDAKTVRRCFQLLRQIQYEAQQQHGDYSEFAELSMGMSHDMKIAIEEGSTMLRIGRAIFGERDA